jgi:hypothetical protein
LDSAHANCTSTVRSRQTVADRALIAQPDIGMVLPP